MVIPNIDDIYRWYKINGCPTRQDVREGKVNLPEGASKSLIESLIPYFNSKDINTIYIPTDENKEEVSMVITSDWHIPFHDKEVLKTFINFLYEYQPDELVLNGNINDCTAFSTHPKLRDVATAFRTAREEREYWFPIAELLREVLPDSKITYIGSQCHEGWIDKWTALSPILLEDENYTIKNWFKLDDFGIEYVPEVYDPVGDATFLISHGTIARGKSGASAMASLEMEGTSTCVAHTHKLSQVFKTNAVGEIVGLESLLIGILTKKVLLCLNAQVL